MQDFGISQHECDIATSAVDQGDIDGYQYPPLWCLGVPLILFLDILMHLLGLGIVKFVMKRMI